MTILKDFQTWVEKFTFLSLFTHSNEYQSHFSLHCAKNLIAYSHNDQTLESRVIDVFIAVKVNLNRNICCHRKKQMATEKVKWKSWKNKSCVWTLTQRALQIPQAKLCNSLLQFKFSPLATKQKKNPIRYDNFHVHLQTDFLIGLMNIFFSSRFPSICVLIIHSNFPWRHHRPPLLSLNIHKCFEPKNPIATATIPLLWWLLLLLFALLQ